MCNLAHEIYKVFIFWLFAMMACEFEHTTMKQYTVFFIQLFNQINLIN